MSRNPVWSAEQAKRAIDSSNQGPNQEVTSLVRRPASRDVILRQNELTYASFYVPRVKPGCAPVYVGALFAKVDLPAGAIIAKYEGREYPCDSRNKNPIWNQLENTQYLLTRWNEKDRRKRIVVDGNPIWGGIGGYANYSKSPNVRFLDWAKDYPDERIGGVYLQTTEFVERGTELRVDYDLGSEETPFLTQMLRDWPDCIPKTELFEPHYRALRYTTPPRSALMSERFNMFGFYGQFM